MTALALILTLTLTLALALTLTLPKVNRAEVDAVAAVVQGLCAAGLS